MDDMGYHFVAVADVHLHSRGVYGNENNDRCLDLNQVKYPGNSTDLWVISLGFTCNICLTEQAANWYSVKRYWIMMSQLNINQCNMTDTAVGLSKRVFMPKIRLSLLESTPLTHSYEGLGV